MPNLSNIRGPLSRIGSPNFSVDIGTYKILGGVSGNGLVHYGVIISFAKRRQHTLATDLEARPVDHLLMR